MEWSNKIRGIHKNSRYKTTSNTENTISFHDILTAHQKWTWGESNSRPNEETICFLHAYLCLRFSSISKTKATNLCLIS